MDRGVVVHDPEVIEEGRAAAVMEADRGGGLSGAELLTAEEDSSFDLCPDLKMRNDVISR